MIVLILKNNSINIDFSNVIKKFSNPKTSSYTVYKFLDTYLLKGNKTKCYSEHITINKIADNYMIVNVDKTKLDEIYFPGLNKYHDVFNRLKQTFTIIYKSIPIKFVFITDTYGNDTWKYIIVKSKNNFVPDEIINNFLQN